MQIYLANELGYFEFKDGQRTLEVTNQERLMKITKLIDEVGKLIGAWIKQNDERVDKNG